MNSPKSFSRVKTQSGSFIIEAMISLLLFAVGLIGLMALSAQAVNQIGQSKVRNDASYLAGELIGEMWVSANVNIGTWLTRLETVIPGASASSNVYLSSCDCVDTDETPPGPNACSGATTGTVAVANPQPVTICIKWTDRKDPSNPRRYSTSSLITRN